MALQNLENMATAALRLADIENAANRFPTPEVYTYVNQGIVRVYAEIIVCQDRPYFLTEANVQIVTAPLLGQATVIPLPLDMLQFTSVSWASAQNGPWRQLEPYEETERAALLNAGYSVAPWHFKYGFAASPAAATVGTIPMSMSIDVVPQPPLSSWLKVRYIPTPTPLVNPTDTCNFLLGFDDAAVTWAAVLMRRKDDLDTSALERDFAAHVERIHSIARRRDRSRPPRVQIVRNWGMRGAGRRGRGF